MATDVNICNIALSNLGTKSTIASIDPPEDSNEARQCAILYDDARDYVLRDHIWKFATKTVVLADLGVAKTHWDYSYLYPSDCLRAVDILGATRNDSEPIPFGVGINDAGNAKVILTDQEDAELKYIMRVTNASLFDSQFVETLSWWLAFKLAMPLVGKRTIQTDMLNYYRAALSRARAHDKNEQQGDKPRDAEHIRARD